MKCVACMTAEATVKATFTKISGNPTIMKLCPGCEQIHTLHIPQGDVVSIHVEALKR